MNINLRDAALQDAIKESVTETLDKSATELRVYSRRVADNAVAAATENISRQAARQIADEVEGLLNSRPTPNTQYQEGVRDGINLALRTVERFSPKVVEPTGRVRTLDVMLGPGMYVYDVIDKMLKEARETGDTLETEFNDAILTVRPDDTRDFAHYRWTIRYRLASVKAGHLKVDDLL